MLNPLSLHSASRRFPASISLRTAGLVILVASVAVATGWIVFESNWISAALDYISRTSPLLVAIDFSQSVLLAMGYPGLVLVIFLEHVFPPIPSDIILPLAGYTAATTSMTLFGAIVATTAGSLIGAMALYGAGAWLGEDRVRRLCRRFGKYLTFEERELDRSMDWFRKHGSVVVMVARVVPVFRSLISIPAGMSGMPIGRFLIFTALGAAAWNSSLITGGYLLGSNWELVVTWMDQYQVAMAGVNLSAFLVIATLRVRSYRRRSRE